MAYSPVIQRLRYRQSQRMYRLVDPMSKQEVPTPDVVPSQNVLTTYILHDNLQPLPIDPKYCRQYGPAFVINRQDAVSAKTLASRILSTTTPFLCVLTSDVSFEQSLFDDAVHHIQVHQDVQCLSAATKTKQIGTTSNLEKCDCPINGFIIAKNSAFVPLKGGDDYDDVFNWLSCVACPHVHVSDLFYRRISGEPAVSVKKTKSSLNGPHPENTLFFSAAVYADPHVNTVRFARSARRFGIPIRYIDWGGYWRGFVYHKVFQFVQNLKQWRSEGYKYAFILDSFDIVFAGTPEEICRRADDCFDLNVLTFNAEAKTHIFPFKERWYWDLVMSEGCHLNAGNMFGSLDVIEEVAQHVFNIQNELLGLHGRPGVLQRICKEPIIVKDLMRYVRDDQFIYQICSLYYPQYFDIDRNKDLLVWSGVSQHSLADARRLPAADWNSLGKALIIHSSAAARHKESNWTEWCEKEGLLAR